MIAFTAASSSARIPYEREHRNRWQDRFEQLIPAIVRHARYCARNLPADDAEEAIQEALATAFVAYARLVKVGKEDSTRAGPLARYAVRRCERSHRCRIGKCQ